MLTTIIGWDGLYPIYRDEDGNVSTAAIRSAGMRPLDPSVYIRQIERHDTAAMAAKNNASVKTS